MPKKKNKKQAMNFQSGTMRILYALHGEEKSYLIQPSKIFLGQTQHYQGEQWLMEAHDLGRDEQSIFALSHIKKIERCHGEPFAVFYSCLDPDEIPY